MCKKGLKRPPEFWGQGLLGSYGAHFLVKRVQRGVSPPHSEFRGQEGLGAYGAQFLAKRSLAKKGPFGPFGIFTVHRRRFSALRAEIQKAKVSRLSGPSGPKTVHRSALFGPSARFQKGRVFWAKGRQRRGFWVFGI